MALYTAPVLVITLCAATAHSLQCYTCLSAFINSDCMTATTCPSNATYCQTMENSYPAGGISVVTISKSCEVFCTPFTTSVFGGSTSVSCCSTDLCNFSGGAIVESSYAAIILALGSILTILKSSVL